MAVYGKCSGDNFIEMEEFGNARKNGLEGFLELPTAYRRAAPFAASLNDWPQKSSHSTFQTGLKLNTQNVP